MLKKLIRSQLEKRNLIAVRKEIAAYPTIALSQHIDVEVEQKIDSVIFSKDRAIQLHAFIESYFDKVDGAGTLYVLYKATANHSKSYDELQQIWKDKPVVFVQETDFRLQLNEIVARSTAKLIGFYVDDMIFTCPVSYSEILSFDPLKYIVSLSRGLDFHYSQVLEKELTMPQFKKLDGSPYYEFRWDFSEEFSDWTYPLGVSAYFYSRAEIAAMFGLIFYKAPNSLESAMQLMMPFFKHRKGLCMDKVACTIVPVNLVQQECVNPVTGHATVEDLLRKWDEGYKVDISKFEGVGINGLYMDFDYIKR